MLTDADGGNPRPWLLRENLWRLQVWCPRRDSRRRHRMTPHRFRRVRPTAARHRLHISSPALASRPPRRPDPGGPCPGAHRRRDRPPEHPARPARAARAAAAVLRGIARAPRPRARPGRSGGPLPRGPSNTGRPTNCYKPKPGRSPRGCSSPKDSPASLHLRAGSMTTTAPGSQALTSTRPRTRWDELPTTVRGVIESSTGPVLDVNQSRRDSTAASPRSCTHLPRPYSSRACAATILVSPLNGGKPRSTPTSRRCAAPAVAARATDGTSSGSNTSTAGTPTSRPALPTCPSSPTPSGDSATSRHQICRSDDSTTAGPD